MKKIMKIIILLGILFPFFYERSQAQQSNDIQQCIQELKQLQREFHSLLGEGWGPRSFYPPNGLRTNYEYYKQNPSSCYRDVNELIQFNAGMKERKNSQTQINRNQQQNKGYNYNNNDLYGNQPQQDMGEGEMMQNDEYYDQPQEMENQEDLGKGYGHGNEQEDIRKLENSLLFVKMRLRGIEQKEKDAQRQLIDCEKNFSKWEGNVPPYNQDNWRKHKEYQFDKNMYISAQRFLDDILRQKQQAMDTIELYEQKINRYQQ